MAKQTVTANAVRKTVKPAATVIAVMGPAVRNLVRNPVQSPVPRMAVKATAITASAVNRQDAAG